MRFSKLTALLLAFIVSFSSVDSVSAKQAKAVQTSSVKVAKKAQSSKKAQSGKKSAKASKVTPKKAVNAKKSKTQAVKSTSKNATPAKTQFGIKGAALKPSKVSNKTYRYQEKGKTHQTIGKEASRQYGQVGTASYYGGMFHGRKTASGDVFNENGYTAAHKTLALGSYALVTNLRNGRKVIVRINDRGPFSKERIIDLSKGAARELGMISAGVSQVRVEAMQVDSQGYISGKAARTLYQLAKKEGLPLKVKNEDGDLAFKTDDSASAKQREKQEVKTTAKRAKSVQRTKSTKTAAKTAVKKAVKTTKKADAKSNTKQAVKKREKTAKTAKTAKVSKKSPNSVKKQAKSVKNSNKTTRVKKKK